MTTHSHEPVDREQVAAHRLRLQHGGLDGGGLGIATLGERGLQRSGKRGKGHLKSKLKAGSGAKLWPRWGSGAAPPFT